MNEDEHNLNIYVKHYKQINIAVIKRRKPFQLCPFFIYLFIYYFSQNVLCHSVKQKW